jgi:hypothetical protein
VDPFLARRLRTSPALEIVVADRLTPEERRALGATSASPDLFGLLRAVRSTSMPVAARVIDRDTALLLYTLREPGPLPDFARRLLGRDAARTVARWVADGVLEIEVEGSFLAGPAALASTPLSHLESAPSGAIPRLTAAALGSAACLETFDVERLAFHLYAANRRPLDAAWRRRLPDAEAILAALGLASGGPLHGELVAEWAPSRRTGRWLHWRSRGNSPAPPPEAAVFKLYLSPTPEALLAGFVPFLSALRDCGAFEIKLGADAAGLLRPDKLVAYFADFDRLADAALHAAETLAGLPAEAAQGVPLTAPIDAAGLLSWGLDPAAGDWGSPGDGESWRFWVARLLARALLAAREAGLGGEDACAHAWRRAELEGIDVASWAPSGALRRAMGVTE